MISRRGRHRMMLVVPMIAVGVAASIWLERSREMSVSMAAGQSIARSCQVDGVYLDSRQRAGYLYPDGKRVIVRNMSDLELTTWLKQAGCPPTRGEVAN
jgi:hypothetical protein